MADSEGKSNKTNSHHELAEAFMLLNTSETVSEEVKALRDIARDPKAKPMERIGAIKTIWDYAMSKPKQGLDITTKDKSINTTDFTNLTDGQIKELIKLLTITKPE